jgi:DNA-binding GntR family transcriptional regulator
VVEVLADVESHLRIAPQTQVLQLDRLVFTRDGPPIEWRIGLCPLLDRS